jgi:glycosyltransferase involved in cell wall biosynthesis
VPRTGKPSPPDKPALLLAVDLYPDGGGISAIIENCVQMLDDRYEVHVAIVDEREGRRASLPLPEERVHVLGTRPLVKPYLAPTSLVYPLRVGRFLRTLVKRLQPAALLVQDGLFLPSPGLIATRRTATKLVIMDHGTLTNTLDPDWQAMFPSQMRFPKSWIFRIGFALDRPWRELRWRLGFRRADAVWYVGEEMKPLLGPAQDRAHQYKQVVPNDFHPPTPAARAAARERFGVRGEARVVNMVTRFGGEKGLPEVVAALGDVLPRHPDATVLIAGHGPEEAWLRAQLARLDLGDRVQIVGKLDRPAVRALHHASDYHLYAGTIGCGMSLALLEAMHAAVVPIVSDVPRQHRELADPAGWVFAAGDPDALATALDAALSVNGAELDRRREQALASVRAYARPSVADMVDGLVAA